MDQLGPKDLVSKHIFSLFFLFIILNYSSYKTINFVLTGIYAPIVEKEIRKRNSLIGKQLRITGPERRMGAPGRPFLISLYGYIIEYPIQDLSLFTMIYYISLFTVDLSHLTRSSSYTKDLNWTPGQ